MATLPDPNEVDNAEVAVAVAEVRSLIKRRARVRAQLRRLLGYNGTEPARAGKSWLRSYQYRRRHGETTTEDAELHAAIVAALDEEAAVRRELREVTRSETDHKVVGRAKAFVRDYDEARRRAVRAFERQYVITEPQPSYPTTTSNSVWPVLIGRVESRRRRH